MQNLYFFSIVNVLENSWTLSLLCQYQKLIVGSLLNCLQEAFSIILTTLKFCNNRFIVQLVYLFQDLFLGLLCSLSRLVKHLLALWCRFLLKLNENLWALSSDRLLNKIHFEFMLLRILVQEMFHVQICSLEKSKFIPNLKLLKIQKFFWLCSYVFYYVLNLLIWTNSLYVKNVFTITKCFL